MRRNWIPTATTIPALIILVILGSWQVQRLMWKRDLIATIDAQMVEPPLPLGQEKPDLQQTQYRRVSLEGVFLDSFEQHLFTGPKVIKGKPGYDILTPFQLKDGPIILVNRGWVPTEKKEAGQRPDTVGIGMTTIEGMVHRPESKTWAIPENEPENNLWFFIDVAAMLDGVEGNKWDHFYVRATSAPTPLPIPGQATVTIRNDHLQYALTWYALAIALLVIYLLYRRKNRIPS